MGDIFKSVECDLFIVGFGEFIVAFPVLFFLKAINLDVYYCSDSSEVCKSVLNLYIYIIKEKEVHNGYGLITVFQLFRLAQ